MPLFYGIRLCHKTGMERLSHFQKLERMYLKAPANEYFKPSIEVSDGAAVVEILAREDFYHAASAVHGSVYFKMLDDAAFFAVSSVVEDVFVLTASFNIYLLRPVTNGLMTAKGRVVNQTRRLIIAESELYDEQERVIARGSGTFMKSSVELSPELGYE